MHSIIIPLIGPPLVFALIALKITRGSFSTGEALRKIACLLAAWLSVSLAVFGCIIGNGNLDYFAAAYFAFLVPGGIAYVLCFWN
jgi:hypothetical protein